MKKEYFDLVSAQDWDSQTELELLTKFIDDNGYEQAVMDYFLEVAAKENAARSAKALNAPETTDCVQSFRMFSPDPTLPDQ